MLERMAGGAITSYLLGAVLSALSVLSKIDRSVFSCFFRDCRSLLTRQLRASEVGYRETVLARGGRARAEVKHSKATVVMSTVRESERVRLEFAKLLLTARAHVWPCGPSRCSGRSLETPEDGGYPRGRPAAHPPPSAPPPVPSLRGVRWQKSSRKSSRKRR
jgi:hypothetical protein